MVVEVAEGAAAEGWFALEERLRLLSWCAAQVNSRCNRHMYDEPDLQRGGAATMNQRSSSGAAAV